MYIKLIFLCFIFKSICGSNIEKRLIKRYNDVRSECIDERNHTKPAYECSGLLARGLNNIGGPQQRYAWSKKDTNVRKNAFSVAFLRKDQQFDLVYDSGFIYYPHLKTPKGKYAYHVYCAFPLNGWTDFRDGRHGCGKFYSDTSGNSGHCNAQGITSIKKWIKHFEYITSNVGSSYDFGKYQCSFDMTTTDGAKNFAIVLEARKHLEQNSWQNAVYHNEIVIKAWNENHPEKLPIEAFYYLLGYNSGRENAFMYQRDYLKLTGEKIPVVGIRLPQPGYPRLVVEYQRKK